MLFFTSKCLLFMTRGCKYTGEKQGVTGFFFLGFFISGWKSVSNFVSHLIPLLMHDIYMMNNDVRGKGWLPRTSQVPFLLLWLDENYTMWFRFSTIFFHRSFYIEIYAKKVHIVPKWWSFNLNYWETFRGDKVLQGKMQSFRGF